jgi:hypothetical protein
MIAGPDDNPGQIIGSLFSRNFPSWNKDHCVGTVSIDTESTLSGHILFTAYTN